jgi:hypothetical protein
MECAQFRWASALTVVVLACACSSGGAIPPSNPSADLPAGCTAAFGVAQVARLLNVLGGGDSARVGELIVPPAPGRDGLEMTPTIQDFLVNAKSSSGITVHDQSDLNSLVHDVAGLRFELRGTPPAGAGEGLQAGPGAWTGPAVGVGPVLWRAAGPAVSAQHHQFILGGGKTIVECPSGQVARALFSPHSFA